MVESLHTKLEPNGYKSIRQENARDLVDRLNQHYLESSSQYQEWRKRMNNFREEREERFSRPDGSFDRAAYISSGMYDKYVELSGEQIAIMEAEKENADIRKRMCGEVANIKIDQYAIDKCQYFIDRFKELRDERGIGKSYELAFFLLADKGSFTIDDAILGNFQKVTPTFCKVSTPSRRAVPDKEILGWGHSHADFSTFFSAHADDPQMVRSFNHSGIRFNINDYWGEEKNAKFYYGMVFNEARDAHSLRLIAKMPQYRVERRDDGKIHWIKDYVDLDFENVPSRSYGQNKNWLQEEVFDDGRMLTDEEKEVIERKLLQVELDIGSNQYKKLSDFPIKESLIDKLKNVITPKAEVVEDSLPEQNYSPSSVTADVNPSELDDVFTKEKKPEPIYPDSVEAKTTKTSYQSDTLDEKLNENVATEEPNLYELILSLQSEVDFLKKSNKEYLSENASLRRDISSLRSEYDALATRVDSLETYRSAMQVYARQDDVIGDVANILLGDRKASWKWEDRKDKFLDVARIVGVGNLSCLVPVIESNKYLRNNHLDIYNHILAVCKGEVELRSDPQEKKKIFSRF